MSDAPVNPTQELGAQPSFLFSYAAKAISSVRQQHDLRKSAAAAMFMHPTCSRAVAVGEAVTVVVATYGGNQVSEPKGQKVKELRHDRLDFHDDRRQRTTLTTQPIGTLLSSLDPADSYVLSLAAPSHIGNTASPWIGLGIGLDRHYISGNARPSS
ncbi:hypothetical protein E4U57_002127 [Claviceps arundinis]|uniref:Uncharacterized protein n=1 Tax=Claviceps arundinis TaxID=1623583 RepID=A0ABQ7P922_9HYPO|nr:hypothetical protein E4U57_002127 [Claviceps arundinis]